jgi:vitamin K-dependent gamma-carboxylase
MRLPVWRIIAQKGPVTGAPDHGGASFTNSLGELRTRLSAPVDIASLVYFRIAFGAIMLWEVWRYFDHGWIDRYYVEPAFHFTYYGFDWVRPWAAAWMMDAHFYSLAVLAVLIILGLWYRVAAVLFFLGFTYVFLLDQSRYLNHFYLISLLSFLLIFMPAHRAFSLDAARRPGMRSDTAPAWALWVLRAQIAVVYFNGGLAKLNADWLRGEPMREWLADRTDFPLIGRWFTEEWMVYLFSGGLLLDLFIVPFLLWKRTRPFAFLAAAAFHLTNNELFPIDIFPWLAIAATLLFFPPEWPRMIISGKRLPLPEKIDFPAVSRMPLARNAVVGLLAVYLAVQLLVPLRHHLCPGNVSWTEEGHRFAWHMRLRSKSADARFFATDPVSGETWEIDTLDILTPGQEDAMSTRPDMILQLSHYISDLFREDGYDQIQVRATVMASLNSREPQLLIDPNVDLAAQPRSFGHASWINHLE